MIVTAMQVFNRMVETDNKNLMLAPLSNVLSLRKVKAGTQIRIGIPGDLFGKIVLGKMCGGLLLCDIREFQKVKAEMEATK